MNQIILLKVFSWVSILFLSTSTLFSNVQLQETDSAFVETIGTISEQILSLNSSGVEPSSGFYKIAIAILLILEVFLRIFKTERSISIINYIIRIFITALKFIPYLLPDNTKKGHLEATKVDELIKPENVLKKIGKKRAINFARDKLKSIFKTQRHK